MPLTIDDQYIALNDASGSVMDVRVANTINGLSQSFYLFGGVDTTNAARFLKVDNSGSLQVILSGTNSIVSVSNMPVTQAVNLVTGSAGFNANSPFWITGSVQSSATFPSSMNVTLVTSSVTQSVTGSVFVLNLPTTQSVFLASGSSGFSTNSPLWVTGAVQSSAVFPSSLNVTLVTSSVTQSVYLVSGAAGFNSNTPLWVTGAVQSSAVFPSSLNVSIVSSSITQSVILATVTVGTGSTSPISGVMIGGTDAQNRFQEIKVDPTGNQYMAITSPSGALAGLSAFVSTYGTLRTSDEPSALFSEDFDTTTIDTTNKWITGSQSGANLAIISGALTMSVGVAANAGAFIQSIAAFPSVGLGFRILGFTNLIETAAITNNHKFWGFASQSGTWNTTAPITNGIGFEQTIAGEFFASVYSNNSRIFSQSLSKPTDGQIHRYALVTRADAAFWYQDGIEIPVASTNFPLISTYGLPIRFHTLNHSSGPASQPTSSLRAVGLADSARSNMAISDGAYPWRKATVDFNSALVTKEYTPKTFVVLLTGSSIALTKSMVSLHNASTDRTLKLQSVKIINAQSASVTGIMSEFRLLKITSHSAGQDLFYDAFDSIDTINPRITAKTNATITGEAVRPLIRRYWNSDEFTAATLVPGAFDKTMASLLYNYEAKPGQKPITIRPNEGLTVKHIPASAIGLFDIELIVTEDTIY